jgi:hypothetical protein
VEDNRLLALPNEFPRFTCGKQSFFLRMFRVQMYAFFSKHAALSSWNYCSILISALLPIFAMTKVQNIPIGWRCLFLSFSEVKTARPPWQEQVLYLSQYALDMDYSLIRNYIFTPWQVFAFTLQWVSTPALHEGDGYGIVELEENCASLSLS